MGFPLMAFIYFLSLGGRDGALTVVRPTDAGICQRAHVLCSFHGYDSDLLTLCVSCTVHVSALAFAMRAFHLLLLYTTALLCTLLLVVTYIHPSHYSSALVAASDISYKPI